jgi:hypothetical protein
MLDYPKRNGMHKIGLVVSSDVGTTIDLIRNKMLLVVLQAISYNSGADHRTDGVAFYCHLLAKATGNMH